MKPTISTMCLFAGVALMLFSITNIIPLEVVSKEHPSIPEDGQTYPLLSDVGIITTFWVEADNKIWEVSGVWLTIYQGDTVVRNETLIPWSYDITADEMTWSSGIEPLSYGGTYTFTFFIQGGTFAYGYKIVSQKSGTFYIDYTPPELHGNWYVGSEFIITQFQKVNTTKNNIMFEFIRTSLVPPDTEINVMVSWSNETSSGTPSGTQTLTHRSNAVWWDIILLQDDTYDVKLSATCVPTSVEYFIVLKIQEPSVPPPPPPPPLPIVRILFGITGIALIGIGVIKRKQTWHNP